MSNQVEDCFKFLWSFQNVRTLIMVITVSTGRVVLSLCICLVSVLFYSDPIRQGSGNPFSLYSNKKEPQFQIKQTTNSQIIFNFANPSIVWVPYFEGRQSCTFSFPLWFSFCSVWIWSGREATIPLHYFPTIKSPNPRPNKQQIMFNFANPSIVLGALLRRQTESSHTFSCPLQFSFCSVLLCSDPIRRGSGNPSSSFPNKKSQTPRSNKQKHKLFLMLQILP